jgi:hypothetical protein
MNEPNSTLKIGASDVARFNGRPARMKAPSTAVGSTPAATATMTGRLKVEQCDNDYFLWFITHGNTGELAWRVSSLDDIEFL